MTFNIMTEKFNCSSARKYYYITDKGREELEIVRKEWLEIKDPITKLLKGSNEDV